MSDFLRLDKWLWHARFFKSRALATRFCEGGNIRVNSIITHKPHFKIFVGYVLTFSTARRVRLIKVHELGVTRRSAVEAQKLYEELNLEGTVFTASQTISVKTNPRNAERYPGSGRPTKVERRALGRLKDKYEQ